MVSHHYSFSEFSAGATLLLLLFLLFRSPFSFLSLPFLSFSFFFFLEDFDLFTTNVSGDTNVGASFFVAGIGVGTASTNDVEECMTDTEATTGASGASGVGGVGGVDEFSDTDAVSFSLELEDSSPPPEAIA